ncbi:MAG: PilZ domain-containing protein [Bryobacteraceae bacterium]
MRERRTEPRLLCADLVELEWRDKSGRRRRAVANLEDISLSGACLQLEVEIPLQTELRISYATGELTGIVRYCVYREIGYFLGIQFDDGVRWSQRAFRPLHLFDPRRLMSRKSSGAQKSA